MAIVTFEDQTHTLSIADLREVMQAAWAEPVDDPHQYLFEVLSQPTHPRAAATIAVLRRVFSLLTVEAASGAFRPRWADEAQSDLVIDIEKNATTKGAIFTALLAQPEAANLAYIAACYLTWRERQADLTFLDLLGLQPMLQRVVEQGRAEVAETQMIFGRLIEVGGEPGHYLPLGF